MFSDYLSLSYDYGFSKTGRRIFERNFEHNEKDKNNDLFKHAVNQGHLHVDLDHIKIMNSGYHNNKFKRNISEILYVKLHWSSLNTEELN